MSGKTSQMAMKIADIITKRVALMMKDFIGATTVKLGTLDDIGTPSILGGVFVCISRMAGAGYSPSGFTPIVEPMALDRSVARKREAAMERERAVATRSRRLTARSHRVVAAVKRDPLRLIDSSQT
jgi:hypothetical protein